MTDVTACSLSRPSLPYTSRELHSQRIYCQASSCSSLWKVSQCSHTDRGLTAHVCDWHRGRPVSLQAHVWWH